MSALKLLREQRAATKAEVLSAASACHYCARDDAPLTVDHVIPVSRGGSDDISNLVAACRSCNSKKNRRTPAEWANGVRLRFRAPEDWKFRGTAADAALTAEQRDRLAALLGGGAK